MTVETKQQLAKVQSATEKSLEGLDEFFQPPRLAKPEMHLLLKPFFLLDRHADRFKPIEYGYSVISQGKAITRGWTVQPHFKYGLPGPFDRDVTVVIYEIVNEQYLAKKLPVPETMPIGSLRDFAKKMGINASGKNLASIKESLKRLMNTLASCEETFFDNKKHRYVSLSFRLLKAVCVAGEDDGNGGKYEQNFIVFDESILRNLNSGYVMVVDVESFHKIKKDIGKQLYTHLAYRFFVEQQEGNDCWTADYEWLCVHLGIKPRRELRRAKQQLHAAHEELKQLGYISDYQWDGWRVLYRPGHVWRGEQLRRASGKTRYLKNKTNKPTIQKDMPLPTEISDPILPALTAFASGLPELQERIKKFGLTREQAEILCIERSIPVRNSK